MRGHGGVVGGGRGEEDKEQGKKIECSPSIKTLECWLLSYNNIYLLTLVIVYIDRFN